MSFHVGGAWIDAPKGSLVIAPGGSAHDFEDRAAKAADALNISVPGDFEPEMNAIADWFRARTTAASRTAKAPRGQSRVRHSTLSSRLGVSHGLGHHARAPAD